MRDVKTKSSCIHTLLFSLSPKNITNTSGLHSLFSQTLLVFRVKNQFKEDSKTSKTMKEATKEIKNDVAGTKC